MCGIGVARSIVQRQASLAKPLEALFGTISNTRPNYRTLIAVARE